MAKSRESRASLADSEMADESNVPTTAEGSEHEANDDGDVSMDVRIIVCLCFSFSCFSTCLSLVRFNSSLIDS